MGVFSFFADKHVPIMRKRLFGSSIGFFCIVLLSLISSICFPGNASAAVVYQSEPNTANTVLICRFSDDNYDDYNSVLYAGKTKWAALIDSFNSTDSSVGEFRNYILTASNGRLNVESVFPQNLQNGKMEYLDLDISSDEYNGSNDDQKLFGAIERAFNRKYSSSSKFDMSKTQIENRGSYIDNVMIGLQMPNGSGKEITSHEGNGSAFNVRLGFLGYQVGEYEVMSTTNLGGWSGSLDGVPAHEYLHSRGSIDLYRVNGTAKPAAGWDIMASALPSLLPLAVTREDMGWGDVNFVGSGVYELGTCTSGSRYAVAFKSPMNDDEYFVAEYRKGDIVGANGYKADKRLGNKSAFDSSGSRDGIVLYRVSNRYGTYERGGDGTGNRVDGHDYIYIFRDSDTIDDNPGGDSAASSDSASLAPGESFGNVNAYSTIHDNALCYSDGANSMITVSVESIVNDKVRLRIDIPDYNDDAFWKTQASGKNNAKSFDAIGATRLSTVVQDKYQSWGGAFYSASGYGIHKIIRSDGSSWTDTDAENAGIVDADLVLYDDHVYDVVINADSVKINRYENSYHNSWSTVASGQINNPNLVRAYVVDGKMNIVVVDENHSRAIVYEYDSYNEKLVLIGDAVNGTYINDAVITSSGDLVLADFFGKNLLVFAHENNSWIERSRIPMSARTLTTGSDTYGNDYVLAISGSHGAKSTLYKFCKDGAIQEQETPLEVNDDARLSSYDGNLYMSVSRAVNGVNSAIAFARGASGEWQRLGDRVASPSPDISPISVIDGKAQMLTSNGCGTMRLRTHDALAPAIPVPPSNKVSVTFYPQNGEAKKVVTYERGDNIDFYIPNRSGYSFIGWSTSINGGDVVSSAKANNNTSYYAQWKQNDLEPSKPVEPEQNKYIVTFDSNGGSYTPPVTSLNGKKIVLPSVTRVGYELSGWRDVSSGDVYLPNSLLLIDSNKTLQALWKRVASSDTIADGEYVIGTTLGSNSSFDIENGSTGNCANVRLWDMNFSCAQRFKVVYDRDTGYYEIVNTNSGKALDVQNGAARNGQNVWQYDRNGTMAQRWAISKSDNGYVLESALDRKLVISVSGGSSRAGSNLHLAKNDGTRKQIFTMNPVNNIDNGTYTFKTALDSNRVLDVSCASKEAFANIQIWDSNGTLAQRYRFVKCGNGDGYEIVNVNSGKALDVSNGCAANGVNVQQYHRNSTSAQKWITVDMGNGKHVIASGLHGYVLDVSGGNPSEGSNVQIWSSNGTTAQCWILEKH